jgi:hypothetical protein
MIRYANAVLGEIEKLIDAHQPGWRVAAGARTAALLAAGSYEEGKPSWSDIKPVYMRIQHNKCIFCERPLGGEVAGKIEQDVEHFRPKNALKVWPRKPPKGQAAKYSFSTGIEGSGYFWLAYNLENYAAACKPCNSTRKSNFFPIAGASRGISGQDIAALNAHERPFLVYPLGAVDDDPETLIEFEGILAKPKPAAGHDHHRALVMIDFFGLNTREELWTDRFRAISDIWFKVQTIQTSPDPAQVRAAERGVEDAVSDSAPQAACARSFLRLIEADIIAAWRTFLVSEDYLKTAKQRGE